MFVEVAKDGEVPIGGLKKVKSGERELVLCNCEGKLYAIERRCGHMNSGLDFGALDGFILTCAMHNVQFDVRTGAALNVPITPYFEDPLPKTWENHIAHKDWLEYRIRICDLRTYPTKTEGGAVFVDIGEESAVPCF